MKKITIDEVAKLAFVSRSVVSRVLNDRPNVSQAARERVLKVIEQYNYRPSSVARSLATDRTHEICVLAPRRSTNVLGTAYWSLVLFGISEQCSQRGYHVSVSMVSPNMNATFNERVLSNHAFDGFILIAPDLTKLVAATFHANETPCVLVGHNLQFAEWPSVDIDNVDGGYQVGTHLTNLGHTRIGIMSGPLEMPETQDRKAGFQKALAEKGIALEHVVTGDYSQRSGYALMKQWLDANVDLSAVFCTSDVQAMGALLALHRAGVRVPEDIAVVGFDDLPDSQYTIPPLTTVHQPIYEKGELAANMLIDQMEGPREQVIHQNLPVSLVIRETCGGRATTSDAQW